MEERILEGKRADWAGSISQEKRTCVAVVEVVVVEEGRDCSCEGSEGMGGCGVKWRIGREGMREERRREREVR